MSSTSEDLSHNLFFLLLLHCGSYDILNSHAFLLCLIIFASCLFTNIRRWILKIWHKVNTNFVSNIVLMLCVTCCVTLEIKPALVNKFLQSTTMSMHSTNPAF